MENTGKGTVVLWKPKLNCHKLSSTCNATNSFEGLKEQAACRVANYILFLPCYELCEYTDSVEEKEMLVHYVDSAFFCMLSLLCSLQVLFFLLPFLFWMKC